MIQRKKNAKLNLRYLASDAPLTIGEIYTVSEGPAKGQRVRATRSLANRLAGPLHYYDFQGEERGLWHDANPESQGICPDCGEPCVICECGRDGY